MNQPKVSVLISFYNLAPYVDKTMETVLAQKTNFPVEVLCADDGSDDGTVQICHDNGCPFLDLPCNLGLAGAFQAGIKYAFGISNKIR